MSRETKRGGTAREKEIARLSADLAKLAGLRCARPPSPAGYLTNGEEVYEFYRCPVHNTWMQPCLTPYTHWKCEVDGCNRKRAAKMRTSIERRIFWHRRLAELEERGETS